MRRALLPPPPIPQPPPSPTLPPCPPTARARLRSSFLSRQGRRRSPPPTLPSTNPRRLTRLAAPAIWDSFHTPLFRPISLSATPRESFRAPPPRGLSPICDRRLKPAIARRPPSWHPSPRLTQSTQFQAAPISPRIESRSCAATLQARTGRKKRANTIRFDSNRRPQPSGKGQGLPCYWSGRGGCHHLLVSLTRRWVTHFTQS